MRISASFERLIYFSFMFLILTHIATCFWYVARSSVDFFRVLLAKIDDENPDTWIARGHFTDDSNFHVYLTAFYFVVTTITTVGYGDVSASTSAEQ